MELNKKKLVQGVAVVGFGAALNFVPIPNKIAATLVTGVEIAIAFIESIKHETTEEEDR